jgi:hypothetical protein
MMNYARMAALYGLFCNIIILPSVENRGNALLLEDDAFLNIIHPGIFSNFLF